VNCFIDPANVGYAEFNGKRGGFNHSANILLGDGLLAFDTDFHDREFTEAKHDALMILDYLKEHGYPVQCVIFSGMGFHVKVEHHDLHLSRSYSSRNAQAVFDQYRTLREPIVKDLKDQGVNLDAETTLDARRVIRVVGTVNLKTQAVCRVVRDLEGFTEFDIERLNLEGYAPTIPNKGNDKPFLHIERKAVDPHWRKGERTRRINAKPDKVNPIKSTPKPTPVIYLASPVIGTLDRQVILLRFKSPVNVERLKSGLSRFAVQESLAPFIIFRSRKDLEGIWCLSPSAIQTAGMKRLLKRYPRDNSVYVKFRRRIVPLPLEYVAQSSGVIDSEIPVSRAHWRYLYHYKLVDYVPHVSCGSENLLSMPIGEMNV